MTDIRKIRQGEVLSGLPASGWNSFIDTKKKVDQLLPRGVGKTSPIGDRRITCKVFNGTGSAIDADFPVLKLDSPLYNSDDDAAVIRREIAFNGTTPDSDTQQGNVAILQSPVGTGGNGIRKAVLQGPTWADVEFTAESHTHAAVKSGDNTQLESASSGIQVIWHPTIPDEEYLPSTLRCLVLLGGGGGPTVENATTFAVIREVVADACGTRMAELLEVTVPMSGPECPTLGAPDPPVEENWIEVYGAPWSPSLEVGDIVILYTTGGYTWAAPPGVMDIRVTSLTLQQHVQGDWEIVHTGTECEEGT